MWVAQRTEPHVPFLKKTVQQNPAAIPNMKFKWGDEPAPRPHSARPLTTPSGALRKSPPRPAPPLTARPTARATTASARVRFPAAPQPAEPLAEAFQEEDLPPQEAATAADEALGALLAELHAHGRLVSQIPPR